MSASTTDQGFDMTVGFKGRDIAIVPVTTKADGTEMLIQCFQNDAGLVVDGELGDTTQAALKARKSKLAG